MSFESSEFVTAARENIMAEVVLVLLPILIDMVKLLVGMSQ